MPPLMKVLCLGLCLSLAACGGQKSSECDQCPAGQACDASGVCKPQQGACTSNSQCAARDTAKPYCSTSGACVACLDSTACSGTTPFCSAEGTCRGCSSNAECFAADPANSACGADGSCHAGTITASLSADKSMYVVGTAPVTLTWSTTNATTCQLRDGAGTLSTDTSGTQSYAPTQSVTITLQCQGDGEVARTLDIAFQPAIFVDDDASGTPDGLTWETAYSSLEAALNEWAAKGAHIWVKAGTYTTADQNAPVLAIPDGAQLYGGFANTLTGKSGSVSERSMDPGETTAAVIAPADASVIANTCTTCTGRPVLTVGSNVRLDGFTVRGGKASGAPPDNTGGGIRISGATNITLAHLVVRDNVVNNGDTTDSAKGGGLSIDASTSVRVEDAFIYNNSVHGKDGANAGVVGGGVSVTSGSEVVLQRCHLKSNRAVGGIVDSYLPLGGSASAGGIFSQASALELTDSVVELNVAQGGDALPNTDGTHNDGGGGTAGGLAVFGDMTHAVKLASTRFLNNQAVGGKGSNASYINNPGGTGGRASGGGALLIMDTLAPSLSALIFDGNVAQGGNGGNATPAGNGYAGFGGTASASGLSVGTLSGFGDLTLSGFTFANNKAKVGVGGTPGATCTLAGKYGNEDITAAALQLGGPFTCTGPCPSATLKNSTVTDNVAEVSCNPLDSACTAKATGGGVIYGSTVTYVDGGGNTFSGNKPSDTLGL